MKERDRKANVSHQFIFIEELHKTVRNVVMETWQEAVNLWFDGACHPQFRHQLYIFFLHTRWHKAWSINHILATCIHPKTPHQLLTTQAANQPAKASMPAILATHRCACTYADCG